jgi:sugar-specific transcriptional regulator TrmB
MTKELDNDENKLLEFFLQQGLSEPEASILSIMVCRQVRGPLSELAEILDGYEHIERLKVLDIKDLIQRLIDRGFLTDQSGQIDAFIEFRDPINTIPKCLGIDELPVSIRRVVREKTDLFRIISLKERELIDRVGWASWDLARSALKDAIRDSKREIRLGTFSSKTLYPAISQDIANALRDKVNVKIILFSPTLAAKIEPGTQTDILLRTRDWYSLYRTEQLLASEEKRSIGAFELRWLDDESFSSMQRVTLIDDRWWFLNIHSPGKTRGIEGIVYRGRGDKLGKTTIFNVLEFYWENTWEHSFSPYLVGRLRSILRGIWDEVLLIFALIGGAIYLRTTANELWAGGLLGAAIQKFIDIWPVIQRNLARLIIRVMKPLTEDQKNS